VEELVTRRIDHVPTSTAVRPAGHPHVGKTTEGSKETNNIMMGNGFGMGGGWMWLFGPLLIIAVALSVTLLVRALGGGISGAGSGQSSPPSKGPSRAEHILEERYAAGELTTEEYQERLRTLRSGGG
jgi:putative membrane protein